jgi:hypothetical protein
MIQENPHETQVCDNLKRGTDLPLDSSRG